MKKMCKCHGVSGSCTMKICWQVMPEFRLIANSLLDSYNDAERVKLDRRKTGFRLRRMHSTNDKNEFNHLKLRKPRKDDMVFLQMPPDFCEKNSKVGALGTRGRRCLMMPKNIRSIISNSSLDSNDDDENRRFNSDSCSSLCCGRGYRTKVVEIAEDCDCQFQWCCSVKCKKCKKKIMEYYCN